MFTNNLNSGVISINLFKILVNLLRSEEVEFSRNLVSLSLMVTPLKNIKNILFKLCQQFIYHP